MSLEYSPNQSLRIKVELETTDFDTSPIGTSTDSHSDSHSATVSDNVSVTTNACTVVKRDADSLTSLAIPQTVIMNDPNISEVPNNMDGFVVAHKSFMFPLTDVHGQTVSLGHLGNDIDSTAGLLGAYRYLPQEPVPSDQVIVTDSHVEVQVLDGSQLTVDPSSLAVNDGRDGCSCTVTLPQYSGGTLSDVPTHVEHHVEQSIQTQVEHCVLAKLEQFTPGTAYTMEVISHSPTHNVLHATTSSPESLKKKGGWPKGKKRKKELMKPPPAPVTAYVLYATEKRQALRRSHPELTFSEVTKLLGGNWSNLDLNIKQEYINKAMEDKKRYIEELKEYQSSDAYQTFLQSKRLKDGKRAAEGFCDEELMDDESLHCRVCDVYFSSAHNRKEHIFGRQHLQNLTNEFQKDLLRKEEDKERQTRLEYERKVVALGLTDSGRTPADTPEHPTDTVTMATSERPCRCQDGDVDNFVQQYVERNNERDIELKTLRRQVQSVQMKYERRSRVRRLKIGRSTERCKCRCPHR